jgi:tripartite-type tricarboxylate transporter receptor subunit TctC
MRKTMAILALVAGACTGAHAQEEAFRGKTLEILVGFGAGGGYDTYARALGQYYGRHVPGAPSVVVRNMPGAGSLTVVNHVATAAPRNGLTIATFDPAQMIAPLMGEPNAKFDATKLTWVGSMADSTNVCISWAGSSLKSWDDMMKPGEPAPMGTTGPSDARHQHTAILRNMFGAKLKIIPGYKGSSEVRLAMERGEIAGNCGDSWSSLKTTAVDWLRDRKINILAQFAIQSHPELKDVPLIMDRARNDRDRAALRLLLGPQVAGRPYIAPPDLPAPIVKTLRTAFDDSMKDPDLVAMAKKMDLELSPVTGEAIEKLVAELNRTPRDAIELAKEIVK